MISHQKTMNYARALFNIEGTIEQIRQRQENLEQLSQIISQTPEMIHLLSCPDLVTEAKISLLEKALGKKLDPYVKRLVSLLLLRGKGILIRPIATEYHKLVVYSLKEIEVELTSAEPLTAEVKAGLLHKLEAKFQTKVTFIEMIDPTLLGGFKILVHNQLLDLTIRGRLLKLKKQLLKAKI